MRKHEPLPPDLLAIAAALERHRPQMTDLEHDRTRRRAMVRGSRTTPPTTHPKAGFMRSRLAIMATLVTGIVMSSASAALGITALTSTESASVAQYGAPAAGPVGDRSGSTLGASSQVAQSEGSGSARGAGAEGAAGIGDTIAATAERGARTQRDAQTTRQLTATSARELPFTGYASIPLMLVGLALLATGLVLRRGANRLPAE